MRGRFVCFEGVDGSGKTTQVDLLVKEFQRRELPVVKCFEPGCTLEGTRIRELLLHDKTLNFCTKAQTMLFMAARAELMLSIKPVLDSGTNVIMDRWSYSTFAYQQDLQFKDWKSLTEYVSMGAWPTEAFWLDLPSEIRNTRLHDRLKAKQVFQNAAGEIVEPLDKFEQQGREFYERVEDRYGCVCSACPEMVRLDASRPVNEIHAMVKHALFMGT